MATVAQLSQSLSTAVSTAYPGATHVNVSIEDAVPAPRFGTGVLVRMTVSAILDDNLYYANTLACVAQNYGKLDEVAGWLERVPPILAAPAEPNASVDEIVAWLETRPGELADVKWINQNIHPGIDAASFAAEFYLQDGSVEARVYRIAKDDKGAFTLARVKV